MAPKFRCWFKDTGTQAAHMVEWHELREFKALGDLLKYSGENKLFHLMQSTGLKDKKGVETFEGDVGWDVYGEEYGQVVFEEGCFRFETDELSEALFEVNDDIEIVGNIYENSNLLEQANEN